MLTGEWDLFRQFLIDIHFKCIVCAHARERGENRTRRKHINEIRKERTKGRKADRQTEKWLDRNHISHLIVEVKIENEKNNNNKNPHN